MKKNWKLLIGILFLAGGFGNVTSDIGAAAFGIIVGATLIFWWTDGRKRQSHEELKYQEILAERQQEEQAYQEALAKRQQEEQAYQEALAKRQQEELAYQEALAKRQQEELAYQEALTKRQQEERKKQEIFVPQQPEGPKSQEDQRLQEILAKKKLRDQQIQEALAKKSCAESPSATQPALHTLPIEITDSEEDSAKVSKLEFCRIKLNSKKALTTFDTYVVLDCETSGLSPTTNDIIEIALIKYVNGELVDTFSTLVAPSCPISSRITAITGITNADLKNAPPAEEVIPNVWSFIEGFVLVGHNIPFDIKFLKEEFTKYGYKGQFDYVDTLQLARSAFPDFPNHKLATCIEKLSLSDGQTHRALDDIICTQRLLEKCLAVLLEQKERELAERRAARV